MTHERIQDLQDLIDTVSELRKKCPWDMEQTHLSLRKHLIEEAYEVADVIDTMDEKGPKDAQTEANFKEELGDLLLQVVLHSEITAESGRFNIFDVSKELNEKLIRRHPHVFGDNQVDSAEAAYQNWEKQKAKENKPDKKSVLDGLPRSLPGLQRAYRVIEKVTRVGFQWEDLQGPMDKLDEEVRELKAELNQDPPSLDKVESELGDVLFCLANLAYLKKVDPEQSLTRMLSRFEGRFRHVEKRVQESGKGWEDFELKELDVFWEEAKKQ